MSNTPDDDRIMLDRQDLALDPEGLLDAPDEIEKSEQDVADRAERRNPADDETLPARP